MSSAQSQHGVSECADWHHHQTKKHVKFSCSEETGLGRPPSSSPSSETICQKAKAAWRKSDLGPLHFDCVDPEALRKADKIALSDAMYIRDMSESVDATVIEKMKAKWSTRQRKNMSKAAHLFGYRESIADHIRINASRDDNEFMPSHSNSNTSKMYYVSSASEAPSSMDTNKLGNLSASNSSGGSATVAAADCASCDKTAVAWGNDKIKAENHPVLGPVGAARKRLSSIVGRLKWKATRASGPANHVQKAHSHGNHTR